MRAAFAAGTHFGYFPFLDFLRPQGIYPPPFFGREISTHFSLNHLVKPLLGLAITFAFYGPTSSRPNASPHLQQIQLKTPFYFPMRYLPPLALYVFTSQPF